MKMQDCQRVDLSYFESAPVRITSEVTIAATADSVFDSFEDAADWPKWASAITRVEWTSPKPYGIGTTRTVYMVGGLIGEEEFIDWERGRRMAFRFTRANMPAAAFAEHYTVTDAGPGRVTVRWVMAMTPSGPGRITMPLFLPLLRVGCQWMLGRFGRLVEGQRAPALTAG